MKNLLTWLTNGMSVCSTDLVRISRLDNEEMEVEWTRLVDVEFVSAAMDHW